MIESRSFKQACHIIMATLLVLTSFNFSASNKASADPVSPAVNDTSTLNRAVTINNQYYLKDNWKIQNSTLVGDGDLTKSGYDTTGWFGTTVPNTVLGALIGAGDIPDPFIGDRAAYIDENRFIAPWWYRTEFTLPKKEQGKRILLNFEGIAYKADIWVNGHQIAYNSDTNGSFRMYELDVTDYVTADGTTPNTLAVKVTRSNYGKDFSIFWVDWTPRPADNNMGIWREVFITTTDAVKVRNPYIGSKLNKELTIANLNAYVDLSNNTQEAVSGTLSAVITDPTGAEVAKVSKPVTLAAQAKEVEYDFKSTEYSELNIVNPQLWWPKDMGDHPMYTVTFTFTVNDKVSDVIKQKFGIREITTEMNVSPSNVASLKDMVQFYVNHKPVLIKAGGYSPTDLFLRRDQNANEAVMQYVQDMGLNAIRDEGMFFDDNLLDLLDANGIMYMTGWVCCSRWQEPDQYSDQELAVALDSLKIQLQNLRVHPSMIGWMNGSDNPPSYGTSARGKEVEKAYLDLENKLHWDQYGAIISSGSAKLATYTNTYSGMHMDATYDYAVPAMYFEDMNQGGAFGFTSEAGPGPTIPLVETMKKIIPENALWPYNVGGDNYAQWNYHAARGSFRDLANFNRALDNHYGESSSLEEYNIKAQVQQYEAIRAQYEALHVNKYKNASGWVQWMLNNAWPSLYWNLFDYYLNPNGSYFGAKIANEPLHILFDYGTKEVKIVNSTQTGYSNLKAKVQIYNVDSTKVYDKEFNQLVVLPDGASPTEGGQIKRVGHQDINFGGKINEAYGITKVDKITESDFSLTPTYFIRLELRDEADKLISVNSYAQTLKKDVVRYQNHGWNVTPLNQYADFTDLQRLGAADLRIVGTPEAETNGKEQTLTYTVKNNGDSIAYAVFAKIKKGESGDLVAPVRLEDNYFMLLPGEERTLSAKYKVADLGGAVPVLEIDSYNNIVLAQKGLPSSTNLVFKKTTATASSTQGSNNANNALDSSVVFTKWQSSTNATTGADPQWYKVDLGASTTFSRLILRWDYANYAQNMIVEASDDDTNWQTIQVANNSNGSAMNDIQFAPVKKRYIRVTMKGKRPGSPQIGSGGTGQGVTGLAATAVATSYNLAAFELYGPALAVKGAKTVTTASDYALNLELQNVTSPVFSADVDVNYDSTKFSFVSALSKEKKVTISKADSSVPGVVKLKLKATGARTNLNDALVELQFKAKDIAVIDEEAASFSLSNSKLSISSPSLTTTPEVKGQDVKLVLRNPTEVKDVKAEFDGQNLKVTWQDPDDIVIQKVKVTVVSPANIEPIIVDKGVQAATISGINGGENYSIRISALNDKGSATEGIVLDGKALGPVNGITIQTPDNVTSITTYHGTLQLSAEVTPSYAKDPSVTWSIVAGGNAASINETGLLTANYDGEVVVRATANDGSGVTAELAITITGQRNSAEVIDAHADFDGKQLRVTWKDPEDNVFSKVKITVESHEEIEPIVVDKGIQSAKISGISAGDNYTIRVAALNNQGMATDGIVLSGKAVLPVTGIEILTKDDVKTIKDYHGTLQLTAKVTPELATNSAVTWSIEKGDNVASISETGLLTAINDGVVTVKATAKDGSGVYAELSITVTGQYKNDSSGWYVPGPTTPNAGDKDTRQSFGKEELAKAQDGKVKLALKEGKTEAVLPVNAGEILAGNALELQVGGVSITIPAAALKGLTVEGASELVVRINPDAAAQSEAGYKIGSAYNLDLVAVDKAGKESKLNVLSEPVVITLPYQATAVTDEELLGVYVYNEKTGKWDYVGGSIQAANDTATIKVSGLGKYAVIQYNKTFVDVPVSHWAFRTLQLLSAKHLINGVSDTNFNPSAPTTRAEFAALLARTIGLKSTDKKSNFSDVKATDWFAADVEAAFTAGLIQGVSDSQFAPNAPITREQMAVLIVRAYEYKNGSAATTVDHIAQFVDRSDIPAWGQEEINKAIALKLLNGQGDQLFAPKANTSRAEAAQALLNLINSLTAK